MQKVEAGKYRYFSRRGFTFKTIESTWPYWNAYHCIGVLDFNVNMNLNEK